MCLILMCFLPKVLHKAEWQIQIFMLLKQNLHIGAGFGEIMNGIAPCFA
jgi:hypothetical protein